MMIEAYGAEGAIALSDRFDMGYLKALIDQTAEMRKSDEQIEEDRSNEELDKLDKFIERNQNRSIEIKNKDGTKRTLKLKKFAKYSNF